MTGRRPSRSRLSLRGAAALGALAVGCGAESTPEADGGLSMVDAAVSMVDAEIPGEPDAGPDAGCPSGTDEDLDGLDDGEEGCLAAAHAPVLYMPFDKDWTRPSSAEWYLERTDLRFAHDGGCPDQEVLTAPVDPAELILQWRNTRSNLVLGCSDEIQTVHAETGPFFPFEKFFLTAATDDVLAGVPSDAASTGWPTYTHVYPNTLGGQNVQYWFFYPFNDNIVGFDHEGDWEHITVRIDADGAIDGVWFAGHGAATFVEEASLSFFDDERAHPLVWIADGSHAAYPDEDHCDQTVLTEGGSENCDTVAAHRWFVAPETRPDGEEGIAGAGLLDLGERGGERFLWQRYCGVWGSIGQISPPPQGPLCKSDSRWLRDAAPELL